MGYGEKDNTIGQWSIEKLKFIKLYLPSFINATQKAYHRYYIDAFAGNGKWFHREKVNEEVPGSVLIALDHVERFTKQYFIEKDKKRVENLYQLISDRNASKKVRVYQGDSNDILSEIMNEINKKAPTFVFLDPSGDHLKWKTVDMLSKWRTELFILYPWNMAIVRYLRHSKNIDQGTIKRLDGFFGTHEWFDIYMNRHRDYLMSDLLNLYKRQLRSVGYNYCNVSECFRVPGGPKLYYMIWVGKHPVGKKIMDSIFAKQSDQLSLDLFS